MVGRRRTQRGSRGRLGRDDRVGVGGERRRHGRRVLVGVVLAGLAAVPRDAEAYCRSTTCVGACNHDLEGCKQDGLPLYWPGYCVGFSLQADGSVNMPFEDFERVAARSVVAWSEVPCAVGSGAATLAFVREPDSFCQQAEYVPGGPNVNLIMFQDTRWQYTGQENTLAKTTVTYDRDTGEILDADIELNHAFNNLTTADPGDGEVAYDLQSILTHEVGHFIGLDHTPAFATMNAGYTEGSVAPRILADDDVAAACAAYPPDRNVRCAPEYDGGLAVCRSGGDDDGADQGCSIARGRLGRTGGGDPEGQATTQPSAARNDRLPSPRPQYPPVAPMLVGGAAGAWLWRQRRHRRESDGEGTSTSRRRT
ncbi:MAG: matrixin family metalloprotease [Myxococcota bacterium]